MTRWPITMGIFTTHFCGLLVKNLYLFEKHVKTLEDFFLNIEILINIDKIKVLVVNFTKFICFNFSYY